MLLDLITVYVATHIVWNMQIQTGRDSDGHIVMALVSNLKLGKDQN